MRGPAALSLLALLSGIRTTAAGTCAPRARLAGNAELVVRVATELHRLGIATEPPPAGCAAVEAAVEHDAGGGIAVAIRDAAQRTEGRVVGDAAVAAVWIDSWLRDDFTGPAEVGGAPPALTPASDRVAAVARVEPAGHSLLDQLSLDAAYETTWSDDGSSWTGFGVGACVALDVACVGLRAHAAFQPQLASGMTAASRSDLSALATARRTFSVGRMAISPEVGLGIARLTTTRIDGCKPIPMPPTNCDPMDPTTSCPMVPPDCVAASGAVYVGDHFSTTTWTPRAAAALHVSIPLLDHVWLEGSAGFAATPFRHGDRYTFPPPPGGTMSADPIALPGESLGSYQLGVGLRIGAP